MVAYTVRANKDTAKLGRRKPRSLGLGKCLHYLEIDEAVSIVDFVQVAARLL